MGLSLSMGERRYSSQVWRGREGLTLEACKKIKEEESLWCGEVIGCETIFYDWEDAPLVMDRERLGELARVIREVRPEILITHWPHEKHHPEDHLEDHKIAGEAAVRAAGIAAAPGALRETSLESWAVGAIYYAEPGYPHFATHGFAPNVLIDITGAWEQKCKVLQVSWCRGFLEESYTNCALLRGYQGKRITGDPDFKYGEAFAIEYHHAGELLPYPVARGAVS